MYLAGQVGCQQRQNQDQEYPGIWGAFWERVCVCVCVCVTSGCSTAGIASSKRASKCSLSHLDRILQTVEAIADFEECCDLSCTLASTLEQ